MIEKRCRLMQAYGWDEDYVRKRITGVRGWVYYYWAVAQSVASMMQQPHEPDGGYVAQEIERLRNERRRVKCKSEAEC